MATYYIAAGGTAANKGVANGLSYPSGFMAMARHNATTYVAGDTCIIDGAPEGTQLFLRVNQDDLLKPKTSGTEADPVTYLGVNNAILTAADLIGNVWTAAGANLWTTPIGATVTAVYQVFFNDVRGHMVAVQGDLSEEFEWWADITNLLLYVWSPTDPFTRYTGRGVEVTDSAGKIACCTYSAGSKNWQVFDNIQFEKAKEYCFNSYNMDAEGVVVRNCRMKNGYYAGSRVTGLESGGGLTRVLFEDNEQSYNGGHGSTFGGKTDGTIQQRDWSHHNCHYAAITGLSQHTNVGSLKVASELNINLHMRECIAEYANTTHRDRVATKGSGIWCDVVVTYATIENCCSRYNSDEGIRIEESSYNTLINNLIYSNGTTGLHIAGNNISGRAAVGNKIYNNTIYACVLGIEVNSGFPDGIVDNDFANNIAVGNTTREFKAFNGGENDGVNGHGNRYRNNCFGAEGTDFLHVGGVNYSTYAAAGAALNANEPGTWVSNPAIEVDPLFANVGALEFWLQDTSPCNNQGLNLGAAYKMALEKSSVWPSGVVTVDQGHYGTGWEVGCYVTTDAPAPPVGNDAIVFRSLVRSNAIRMGVTPMVAAPIAIASKTQNLTPVDPSTIIEEWAGAIWYDKFLGTLAAGAVNGTLSTDGLAIRNVIDASNLISVNNGLVLAALAASDIDNPFLAYSRAPGGLTALRAGLAFAVVFTRATVDANGPLFSFSPDLVNCPGWPQIKFTDAGSGSFALQSNEGNTIGDRPWTQAGEQAFIIMARTPAQPGDLTMFMVLRYVSGHTWEMFDNRRTGASNANFVPTITDLVTSAPTATTVRKVVALEMIFDNLFDVDFGRITTYLEAPAYQAAFTHPADCQLRFEFTKRGGQSVFFDFRRDTESDRIQVSASSTGYLQINKYVGGVRTQLENQAGVFPDNVFYEVDIVAEGTVFKVFVNGVLKATETVLDVLLLENTGGFVDHNVDPNDLVVFGGPSPALGGGVINATARVVRPQNLDAGTHDQDCFVAVRDVKLPTVAADVIQLRIAGANELNLEIRPTGAVALLQDTTSLAVTPDGSLTNGKSVVVTLKGVGTGAVAKIFIESDELATYTAPSAATMLAGTGYKFLIDNGFTCGSVEFWPLTFDLPFTLG
jgi:parallel beta-helix repeat protein